MKDVAHLTEAPESLDAPSGLHVHRATRADALATRLSELLGRPLADPFAGEIVCVPTPGMERWLSQQLSMTLGASPGRHDGVCAGVEFQPLDRVLHRLVAELNDVDPACDPWHAERGVWSLLRVVGRCQNEPWFTPLRPSLGEGAQHRWSTAARLVRLFARYAAERPTMLEHWRRGELVDAGGADLGPFELWQAQLWRLLRQEIGGLDPAERTRLAAETLAEDGRAVSLPQRLSVFGATRLAPGQVALLHSLAAHRAVHLWLPHPSPALWQELTGLPAGRDRSRRNDASLFLPKHRLVARLGRDARETQLTLAPLLTSDESLAEPADAPTLLGRLQQAIRLDDPTPTPEPLAADDESVQLHSCYGPDRQVEVLREVVLGLLADEPTLQPRDIVVMCPDIEHYAPLIQSAFALDGSDPTIEHHPGQQLYVRLADRALRELNPLLSTLSRLLELGSSRAGLDEVLDLTAEPTVARRFGFTESDHERLQTLTRTSGVRWGLNQQQRAKFKMERFGQNTWAAGVRRMLLGIAMSEKGAHFRGTVLPLDDIDSQDADLVGRLAEFVDRLTDLTSTLDEPKSLQDWLDLCREALASLTDVPPADAWQQAHAWSALSDLAERAGGEDAAEKTNLLNLGEIRAMLTDAFAGRPSRANFRTGALTLCTMTPMRSVPHRVVCLLGMDDGAFPRRGAVNGDDLLQLDPWVGDRDPRSEDRQILLDSLMAATERFIVIYSGRSPQTGEAKPPCVPIVELREALDALCAGEDAGVPLHEHPLQPFAVKNFEPGALAASDAPFSFDATMCRAAASTSTEPKPVEPTFNHDTLPPLPEMNDEVIPVRLDDLKRFFDNPAKELLRRRAELFLKDDEQPEPFDQLPIELDGLQQWKIGDRLLQAALRGTPPRAQVEPEHLRGELPPMGLGVTMINQIVEQVDDIGRSAAEWLAVEPRSLWADVRIGRYHLTGLVTGLRNTTAVEITNSTLAAKHELRAWIDLLALKTTDPTVGWQCASFGKRNSHFLLGPVAEADAKSHLRNLLDLYVRGLREVLPLPPTAARAELTQNPADWRSKPSAKWSKDFRDPSWGAFFTADFASVTALKPTATDGPGPTRFAALAHLVWKPILEAKNRG